MRNQHIARFNLHFGKCSQMQYWYLKDLRYCDSLAYRNVCLPVREGAD